MPAQVWLESVTLYPKYLIYRRRAAVAHLGAIASRSRCSWRCALPLRADFVAFVDVEEIEESLDIVAVGDAVFLFAFREALAGIVAPTAFAEVAVPDFDFFG